ncbi:uncharacterized protein [Drosophila bipectinata]|uniref:uncharacterized protein n=1 Tax=Drosophila bipectinata TaxID=42026 RepID=UPI001C89C42F|nr:uncharacterized protein LOC122321604 [Drosophila bipectinata]
MENSSVPRNFTNPIAKLLDDFLQSTPLVNGDMCRIIATIFVMVLCFYTILFVARIMVAIALPTFIVVGFLLFYRFVTFTEVKEGLREMPKIVALLANFTGDILNEDLLK